MAETNLLMSAQDVRHNTFAVPPFSPLPFLRIPQNCFSARVATRVSETLLLKMFFQRTRKQQGDCFATGTFAAAVVRRSCSACLWTRRIWISTVRFFRNKAPLQQVVVSKIHESH